MIYRSIYNDLNRILDLKSFILKGKKQKQIKDCLFIAMNRELIELVKDNSRCFIAVEFGSKEAYLVVSRKNNFINRFDEINYQKEFLESLEGLVKSVV